MDVSDPATPSLFGKDEFNSSTSSVAAMDGYAFVGTGGFVSVDVSNPMTPTIAGGSRVPGNFVRDITIRGHHAFVAGLGLAVFDLSNPVEPEQIGFYRVAGQANAVAVAGRYAYVNGSECVTNPECVGGSLIVLDITNLHAPVPVGFYDIPEDTPSGVVADGNSIYVAGGSAGLYVLRYVGGPAVRPVHLPVVSWSAP